MKIVYIAPVPLSLNDSLASRRKACLIADALIDLGHEVILVSTFSAGIVKSENWHQASLGGKTFQCLEVGLSLKSPFGTAVNCLRAHRIADFILDKVCPDVVLMYNTYILETLIASRLAKKTKARLIVEVEDHPLARRRGIFNLKPWLDYVARHRAMVRADGFIVASDQLAKGLPSRKPQMLLPGILDAYLLELSHRRRRPFDGDRRRVGYFGSLSKAKGADVLLAAATQLPHPWQFIVTGSGELAASFEKASQSRPQNLSFLGSVDERRLYELMCSCDVTLIPSESVREGSVFPFKAFECVVAGTHVISAHRSMRANPDLAFTVRWDGSLQNLLDEIQSAERNFNREQDQRTYAIKNIVQIFDAPSVENQLGNLFSRVTAIPAHAPPKETARAG